MNEALCVDEASRNEQKNIFRRIQKIKEFQKKSQIERQNCRRSRIDFVSASSRRHNFSLPVKFYGRYFFVKPIQKNDCGGCCRIDLNKF